MNCIWFELWYSAKHNIHQIIVSVCILTILMQKFILPSSWFGHAMNTKLHETVSNQCMCYGYIQQAMGFRYCLHQNSTSSSFSCGEKKNTHNLDVSFIKSYLYPKTADVQLNLTSRSRYQSLYVHNMLAFIYSCLYVRLFVCRSLIATRILCWVFT